jgi:CHAD domain-containing protein
MARAKQIDGIECDAAAAAGIRLVLLSRIEEMCALRDRALKWSDPEGVHDMRVASRRLRGALRDFLPYLRRRPLASSLSHMRKLARSLGGVRDYDVAIATLKKTAAKAPHEVAVGIRKFADLRQEALEEARIKLTSVLYAEFMSELQSELIKALDAAVGPTQKRKASKQTQVPAASIPYREVARAVILTRLGQFEELSKGLYRPLRVKPLHEMRIAAKHLRYALELFEKCWGEPVAFFAGKVAGFQSSLGALHDCDVWIEDFGKAAASDVMVPGFDHRATSFWLMSHFVKLRSKHLSKALTQWNEWEAEGFSNRLRASIQAESAATSENDKGLGSVARP